MSDIYNDDLWMCEPCRKASGQGQYIRVTYSCVGFSGPEARVCEHLSMEQVRTILRSDREYLSWRFT